MSKETVTAITATENGTNQFSTSPLNMFDGDKNVNYLNSSLLRGNFVINSGASTSIEMPPPQTSVPLDLPATTMANGSSDAFHCHNRFEEKPRINETSKRATRVLWLSIVVCLLFMIITDAAHLLTDLASMLISLFSIYIASRPASQRMSFGWHRAEVFGAFVSICLIWVVTGILVYLAIDRMVTGKYDIDAIIMSITAAIGVAVNFIMGFLLYFGGHSHSHNGTTHIHENGGRRRIEIHSDVDPNFYEEDERFPLVQTNITSIESELHSADQANINVRAAFIHVLGWFLRFEFSVKNLLGDLIQSCGVLFAGLMIFWKVKKVHDLRIWALTMNKVAISVHLEIDPTADSQRILKATTTMLRRDFNVHESTVQIEGYKPEMENCHQCVIPPK
uniref:Zinc transporter n=1 Tax=Meloidogyne hapla TaxID=6305 RepID=A0A1I8BHG8_MELHA